MCDWLKRVYLSPHENKKVVEGLVENRNLKQHSYKVSFISPSNDSGSVWLT